MDVVIPEGMDYAAMGVAFVAAFVLSFLWWGPLFGKTWNRLMGFDNVRQPMGKSLVLQAVGTVFLSYVLWHVMEAFAVTHKTDGTGLLRGELDVGMALMGAFFTWLGFYVPVQLGRVAWEKASWALFGINAGGHLLILAAMGVVFALM